MQTKWAEMDQSKQWAVPVKHKIMQSANTSPNAAPPSPRPLPSTFVFKAHQMAGICIRAKISSVKHAIS